MWFCLTSATLAYWSVLAFCTIMIVYRDLKYGLSTKTFLCCCVSSLESKTCIYCLWCVMFLILINLCWFFAWSLRILPVVKIILIQPLEGSGDWDVFNSRDCQPILMLKHYHLYRMWTTEKLLWRFYTCELIELPLQISFSSATPHFGHLRWNTLVGASEY